VYVHRSIFAPFVEAMATRMSALKVGDPLDPATDVGTLIDEAAAQRVESWIDEAARNGATIVRGGKRTGAQLQPTLLVGVESSMKVVCEEVFGPVANVIPYDSLDEAFAAVNDSEYGLQCGIYTRSNETTFQAIRSIRTGGIIVNGSSTWRTDQLAYGGVKASGMGREGPRYAIRDMTEERLVVFNL
jgi:acyl-CoA reductase-like NAD-dependent aldehyde dehydrogenase